MRKHTAGPWEVIGKHGYTVWAGNEIIAQTNRPRERHKQARADSLLMAAAPDLLKACQLFVAYDASNDEDSVAFMLSYADALAAAKSAITKAEGAS